MTDEMIFFLCLKPRPRLIGAVCCSDKAVDRGPGEMPGACTRPVWMDQLCSACWHERQSFHGRWALFQRNPAAALLSAAKIAAIPEVFGRVGSSLPRGVHSWRLEDL